MTDVIDDVNEEEESLDGVDQITYFGTDFDVRGLVQRLDSGDVIIPRFEPEDEKNLVVRGFQRHFVWKKYQMDRFIESLLLGFPVPGIFLVQNPDKRMLVLDGQQRLTTLRAFYKGVTPDDQVFRLEKVRKEFLGLSYEEMPPEIRRTLDNTFIHATVVKPEGSAVSSAVYQIFERLNTGGTSLSPHEIRVALYNGDLVRLIRDLNSDPSWRALFGKPSDSLKDQELILRFFAFLTDRDKYSKPLKGFLNGYLERHREMEGLDPKLLSSVFVKTCEAILVAIGKDAFKSKRQVNAALLDSLMVGVANGTRTGDLDGEKLKAAYATLLANQKYQAAIGRATADEENVRVRFELAEQAFAA